MARYIHELKNWPEFRWDAEALAGRLGEVRHLQGRLIGRMQGLGLALRQEAVHAMNGLGVGVRTQLHDLVVVLRLELGPDGRMFVI